MPSDLDKEIEIAEYGLSIKDFEIDVLQEDNHGSKIPEELAIAIKQRIEKLEDNNTVD